MTETTISIAAGAKPLKADQLDGLLRGNTLYIQLVGAQGEAAFRFAEDSSAGLRMPSGERRAGTWRIRDRKYCVDWQDGLKNSCTRIVKSDGRIVLIDAAKGEVRGLVEKILPGNPEAL